MPRNVTFEQKCAAMKERSAVATVPTTNKSDERWFAPSEIAARLNVSPDKVRRMFQHEPGVLVIGDQSTTHKRRYTTLRIPESVLQRVLRRMSNV